MGISLSTEGVTKNGKTKTRTKREISNKKNEGKQENTLQNRRATHIPHNLGGKKTLPEIDAKGNLSVGRGDQEEKIIW